MLNVENKIAKLSPEAKEQIRTIAKTENKEVLKQAIEFAQLGGDY